MVDSKLFKEIMSELQPYIVKGNVTVTVDLNHDQIIIEHFNKTNVIQFDTELAYSFLTTPPLPSNYAWFAKCAGKRICSRHVKEWLEKLFLS